LRIFFIRSEPKVYDYILYTFNCPCTSDSRKIFAITLILFLGGPQRHKYLFVFTSVSVLIRILREMILLFNESLR